MDINDFISQTLDQITEAIKNNPSSLDSSKLQTHDLLGVKKGLSGGIPVDNGFVTSVDFDVAVTQTDSKEGGAKLSIGVGKLGGDLSSASSTVSRVKFTVPLYIKVD